MTKRMTYFIECVFTRWSCQNVQVVPTVIDRVFRQDFQLLLMSTEQTPLLGGDQPHADTVPTHRALPPEDIYDRFSHAQKQVILAIVSLTGLVPSMSCIFNLTCFVFIQLDRHRSVLVGASFVPSIPQISRDLNATPAAVRYVVQCAPL